MTEVLKGSAITSPTPSTHDTSTISTGVPSTPGYSENRHSAPTLEKLDESNNAAAIWEIVQKMTAEEREEALREANIISDTRPFETIPYDWEEHDFEPDGTPSDVDKRKTDLGKLAKQVVEGGLTVKRVLFWYALYPMYSLLEVLVWHALYLVYSFLEVPVRYALHLVHSLLEKVQRQLRKGTRSSRQPSQPPRLPASVLHGTMSAA